MKLTRIRLEQVRKFRGAIEIDGLEPGLNLIVGPNESGKSTLASAIRSAFFERYRSVAAESLRPLGDNSAAPAISIDFDVGGTGYRLSKRYLSRPRCELAAGDQRYEGSEAEDRLAALLGYEYAKSGASQAKHQGIPGLLWIEQGQAHALGSVVGHAIEHIRSALGSGSGASQASEEADSVISAVQDMRNALLTPSTGTPRGSYAEALRTVDTLSAELEQLRAEADKYRASVDRLASLRLEHAAGAEERPWEALRRQQRDAEQQRDEIRKLSASLEEKTRERTELENRASLLHDRLQTLLLQERELEAREAAHAKAMEALQSARAQEAHLQQRYAQAHQQVLQSDEALQSARRQLEASRRREQRQALEHRIAHLTHQLEQAQALQSRQTRLSAELAEIALPDGVLEQLRQQIAKRRELGIRRETMATRLAFRLQPDAQVALDGQGIRESGERLLTQGATLSVAGVGEFTITPGGDDLAALQQEDAALARQVEALQSAHDIRDLAHAQERQEKAQHLRNDLALLQRELLLRAPDGIQDMHNQLEQLRIQLQALPVLDEDESRPPADPGPSLQEAESAHAQHARLLETAKQQWHQAQLDTSRAQAHAETAQQEYDKAGALLRDAGRQEQQQRYQRQLVEINLSLADLRQSLQTLQDGIRAARPDILEQDIARYRLSAEQQEQAHHQRAEQLLRLEVELQTLGARGLDEALADKRQALEHARRRTAELERRARALDFLLDRLTAHRRQATQALQAPLQARMLHYLRLLFPEASLDLTEQLAPDRLIRPGGQGQQAELLELLSHGAREQLGIIGRLAYADLLKEAGRPTFILLDDALVHTDAGRLDQMKRVLFDAATRHQILLLSCHPEAWRDLGVLPRHMDSLAVAQGSGA